MRLLYITMQLLSIQEFSVQYKQFLDTILSGALFIYPTDTIYGIWSIVSPETISKIEQAKKRLSWKHYSIIAPSFSRILQHFIVEKHIEQQRSDRSQQFPWRWLTLLLPYTDSTLDTQGLGKISKKNSSLSALSNNHLIWVRYLWSHPFQTFVTTLWQPIITSSCNISGTDPIVSVQDIPQELETHISFCIDGWVLAGQPSVVIDYESGEIVRG
jgi:L-threonylcarbamoyladenylate synthase